MVSLKKTAIKSLQSWFTNCHILPSLLLEKMANGTVLQKINGTNDDQPLSYIIFVRINSLAIFLENLIVAVCLFSQRKKFSKKEFWLHLVCLNINDLFVGAAMFLLSYINHELFNNNRNGCYVLIAVVIISQLALLYNILSICVYRFMFLVCTDRFRFGWKTKLTVFQIVFVYLFCTVYTIIPLTLWSRPNQVISKCAAQPAFGHNKQKVFIFISAGCFIPLIFLNILYCITFYKLRRNLKQRMLRSCNTAKNKPPRTWKLFTHKRTQSRDVSISDFKLTPELSPILQRNLSCQQFQLIQVHRDNKTDKQTEEIQPFEIDEHERQQISTGFQDSELFPSGNNSDSGKSVDCQGNISKITSTKCSKQGLVVKTDNEINQAESGLRKHPKKTCNITNMACVVYRHSNASNQRQILTLIGVILLLMNITVLFPALIKVLTIVIPSWEIPVIAHLFLNVIVMNNSLINPWVYAIQSKEFQAALKDSTSKVSVNCVQWLSSCTKI